MRLYKKTKVFLSIFIVIIFFTQNVYAARYSSPDTDWDLRDGYFYLEADAGTYFEDLSYIPYHYRDADWSIKLPDKGTYEFYKIYWEGDANVRESYASLIFDDTKIINKERASRFRNGKYYDMDYTLETKKDNVRIPVEIFDNFKIDGYNYGGFRRTNRIRIYFNYIAPSYPPEIDVESPNYNQVFDSVQNTVNPIIYVSDENNDNLTCSYFVDGEEEPRDTKNVSNTKRRKKIVFNSLNLNDLSIGYHYIKFKVTDGDFEEEKNIKIQIENSKPTLNIIAPFANQVFSEHNTIFIPKISVSDANNHTLNCKYFIDSQSTPQNQKNISNTATTQTVSFNAINIGTLSEGSHTLKFIVNDGSDTVQDMVSIQVDKTLPKLGNVIFSATEKSISITGSATDTISGMHSTPYRYTIGTAKYGWTTDTTYTKTALIPNTKYLVKFEARDNTNHIASNHQNIYTKAQKPSLVIKNVSDTTIELATTDSNPATTKYQVKAGSQYVTTNGTLTSSPTWITLSGKKIVIKGLSPNQQYAISVKAKNEAGIETAESAKTYLTLANPPSNIQAEETQTEIKLTWNAVSGVKSYDVEIDGSVQNVGTSTSYTHTGLMPETQHKYRIRTRNNSGIGNWSSYITTKTLPYPPETPQNIQLDVEQTTINLSWDTAFRATTYDLEIDGSIIEGITGTSYQHRDLEPKTEHQYRVRAKNKGGISAWSEKNTVSTLPYPPITPTLKVSEMTKDRVNLSWNTVEDGESYHLKVDGFIMDMGTETTYIHEGLEPLSGHTYQIRAVNRGGNSAWSDPLDVTTYPEKPVTPTNIMATAEKTNITVTWYEVPHTEQYEIEIDGNKIVTTAEKMYIHTGLSTDEEHTYKIRAKNISGESEWSNPITMTTLPEEGDTNIALTNVVAIVTNTSITISWDSVAYDADYDIEIDGTL